MAKDRVPASGGAQPDARAKFGYGLRPATITAATKKILGGRLAFPRRGGYRLYVASGMYRGVTCDLGTLKSTEVMERAYKKARSEEVVPEMRASLNRASDRMELERFVKELEADAPLVEEGEVGFPNRVFARQRYANFSHA